MSPAAASASARTTSAASGKNSSDNLQSVAAAAAPSTAARIAKKPHGCTIVIGARPRHDMIDSIYLIPFYSLFALISIMHIGSHSVIPVIWFLCYFLSSSTHAWHFENLAAFSSSTQDTFCMSICFAKCFCFFFLLLFCHVYFINVGYKARYCHEYTPIWIDNLVTCIYSNHHWDLHVVIHEFPLL